jgi:hypothetical protein
METLTKEKCQEYLLTLLANAMPKGVEAVSKAVESYLKFIFENYEEMEPEMKEAANQVKDVYVNLVDATLQEAPDTDETRQLKRQLKVIKNNLPTVKLLMTTLESPSELDKKYAIETRASFEKYCQTYMDLLFDVIEFTHGGSDSFAKISLLFSCIDELVCSFHLAQRGFANQSYTHTRTVFEMLNLIELFTKEPSFADLWCSTDIKKKKKELSPAGVREKLGEKNDPVYAFFSSHGPHPSWDYARIKVGKISELSEKGNPLLTLFVGGTRFENHVVMAHAFCLLALIQALFTAYRIFENYIHKDDYFQIMKTCSEMFRSYMETIVVPELKKMGLDTTDLESHLSDPLIQ